MAMKRILMLLTVIMLLAVGSCSKNPINGDLDGQWQIMSIVYSDGHMEIPEQLYYCFSLHTVYLSAPGSGVGGNMVYEGDKLSLDIAHAEKATDLLPWGINSIVTNFDVVELTSSKLTLKSEYATIEFRKF
jgi:hypothetical protein